ncbi:MAG: glycoside hydrolase family 2 TIM barrel-domain containing protein, partial [bacterium]
MKKNNENHINDWENPRVFEKNQTKPHTTLVPFNTEKKALNSKGSSSDNYFSLNGKWKFNWSQNPELAPEGFYKLNYSYNNWDEIKVPSNWQMEGYGYPLFRNVSHTFPSDPPEVPSDFNPVGSYVKIFELPENWDNRKIFLHFEGVKSASYVWINGEEVGYNQGGMEPAEYDITDYLKSGKNKIAVKVLRYSDGTYLECQDMWRLSGIYRDVYLMSTPQVHIRDFYVTTDLDSSYKDANLKVEAKIKNYKKDRIKNYQFILQLYDEEDKEVFSRSVSKNIETIASGEEKEITVLQKVKNPDKWSAEFPHLYTLTLKLQDENKNTLEVLKNKTGFRQIEIKNQAVYVNGVPVKLNGVNSHMQHPETGRTVDKETMKKDLILMKKFNVNCVRTCHYPPNKEYLELADELGIYIIDEVGDEAHANFHLSEDPDWKGQYLDRMRKMVYRDRNHPSIIFWSAGNESGWGENIYAIIEEGKKIDPSRPGWLYGGNLDENPAKNPIKCEDIVGPRYLKPYTLEHRFGKVSAEEDSRPSFMDEYLSAAGNGLGGLDEYWDLIYKYPRLTGGAIWDWVSPGIKKDVITIPDHSPHNIMCNLMGTAHLVSTENGKAVSLSGHDDWVEVYRDPDLDITGNKLTLFIEVKPTGWSGDGSFLTKGSHQFGIIQSEENELEFYVYGNKKVSVKVETPVNWYNSWHRLAGIYDGEVLKLYIDGKLQGVKKCQQKLLDSPFPVNIGRNAEVHGQQHEGSICEGVIAGVRIFDQTVPVDKLEHNDVTLKEKANLWLDFEKSEEKGDFYSLGIGARSYGLVWPDRTVKPELWQVKKAAQPVAVAAVDLEKGIVEIVNRFHFKNLTELDVCWQLRDEENFIQQGKLELDIEPSHKERVQIPLDTTGLEGEFFLLIKFKLKEDRQWADRGHEVAWSQFKIPVSFSNSNRIRLNNSNKEINCHESAEMIKIAGENFTYEFNKKTGLMGKGSY